MLAMLPKQLQWQSLGHLQFSLLRGGEAPLRSSLIDNQMEECRVFETRVSGFECVSGH